MNYRESINYLLGLVDHERQLPAAPRQKRIYDLRRMAEFLALLDNPHLAAPTVHVAGTKGKGSTAALIDAALNAAGCRTGFYSSPHMHTFRERIRRDTVPIDESQFAGLVSRLAPVADRLRAETDLGAVTLFEFMTGMAFQCFAQESVDFQTIEVGLGGRLDATNVVRPRVCVITSISLDHMAILGDTIAEIAADKAGIIKEGAPVVAAPQCAEAGDVIRAVCRERGASLVQVGVDLTWQPLDVDPAGQRFIVQGRLGRYELTIPLLGRHQLENAAAAVGALECLMESGADLSENEIREGFVAVSWPCRLETLEREPAIVADGAHNVYSMATMLDTLREYFSYGKLIAIAGFSRDKSVAGMVEALAAKTDIAIATRSRHPRSLSPAALAEQMRRSGISQVWQTASVSEALHLARQAAAAADLILGTGSLFVAAELREAVLGIEPEVYPDLLPPDLRQPTSGR